MAKTHKVGKKANQVAPPTHPPSYRRIAECFLSTTEQWGGSYFVSNYDPRDERERSYKKYEMVCEASLSAYANNPIDKSIVYDPWRYKLTLFGTDDTSFGRWFETEQEAMSCLCVLLKSQPITFALCEELGLVD